MIPRPKGGSAGRVITLAALAVIGLLWVRLLVVQPRAEQPAEPVDARVAQAGQRKLHEVSQAVSRLAEATRRGEARSATISFSSADINALLVAQPEVQGELAEARISDPEVHIRAGRVITTATIERGSVPVSVIAEGELEARNGMLLYGSDSVRVAHLPAAAVVRAAVDARIRAVFHRLEQQVHARIDRVTFGRDRITLFLSSRTE